MIDRASCICRKRNMNERDVVSVETRPRNPRIPIACFDIQTAFRARMIIFYSGISGSADSAHKPPKRIWYRHFDNDLTHPCLDTVSPWYRAWYRKVWTTIRCYYLTNSQMAPLYAPQTKILEGRTNIRQRIFKALFKWVSTLFGLLFFEKCFENTLPNVRSAFQNLRLGSIQLHKIGGWVAHAWYVVI